LSVAEQTRAPVGLIEVAHLSRHFDENAAVDEVSFSLFKGEICAFLGPNGAGKTTIIKMLTGLLEPSSGEICYEGAAYHPSRLSLKRMIGVVPQHNNIDKELTLAENLKVHGLLYGLRGRELKQAIEQSLAFADLTQQRDKLAGQLSGGMKRRLVIARALMHQPKILFLDEPTVGLDPFARQNILAFLGQVNRERNCTIFLTTHYMEEAERLADRVIFINRGKIITEGTPQNLKESLGHCVLEVIDERSGHTSEHEFFASRAEAMQRFEALNHQTVSIRETTLEDVFFQVTGARLMKRA
jgi:ABC-2 type transport system ATP-binding protein